MLEALAYFTTANQIKRQRNEEAQEFRRESLLLRAFATLNEHALIHAKLDHYKRRIAFNYLYHAVCLSKLMGKVN